jgi:PAS domain-containing protein
MTVNIAGFLRVEHHALASDGAFLGYIGSCFDITERKLAEEKFQLVLDAAPNAMIVVDSAGMINFANAPAATVFGYSLSELIGRHIETLIPERFRDRHAGYRKGFLFEPSARAMGAVENSSAEQPAAHEFGSWHRVPMRFFRWECSITSPTNRLAKY